MTSKLTRERIELIANFHRAMTLPPSHAEIEELARMALAALDSEPVAWTWHYREQWHVTNDKRRAEFVAKDGDVAVLPPYRHAQPASEREQVRREHAEWSQATFGNVDPVGPLKHLSEEALEAAAEPGDLSEWADMQFLMWDAQRRAGITDAQITQAMIDKLAVNKQREWPEPKDGEPRLHIKEQPAPVVLDGYVMVPKEPTKEMLDEFDSIIDYGAEDSQDAWRRLLAAAPQLPGSEPATVPGKWIPVSERMPETDGNYWGWWSESKRQGPVWFIKSELQAQFQSSEITHWMPLPAAPQEVKSES